MHFTLVVVVAFCVYVEICLSTQQHNEYKHQIYVKEIPKRFEVKDVNARAEFRKYISEINELARKANVTVRYKVKVEVSKPDRKRSWKDMKINKNKSKKYNVPLKKKSMKLSNFEMVMRKHVDAMAKTMAEEYQNPVTTEKQPLISITRWGLTKYLDINGEFGNLPQNPEMICLKTSSTCYNHKDDFMTAVTDSIVMVDYWINII